MNAKDGNRGTGVEYRGRVCANRVNPDLETLQQRCLGTCESRTGGREFKKSSSQYEVSRIPLIFTNMLQYVYFHHLTKYYNINIFSLIINLQDIIIPIIFIY